MFIYVHNFNYYARLPPFAYCTYVCMYIYMHICTYISNIVTQVRLAPSSCLIFNFISRPLHNQRHFERNESKIKLKMTHPQRSWPSRECVCVCEKRSNNQTNKKHTEQKHMVVLCSLESPYNFWLISKTKY